MKNLAVMVLSHERPRYLYITLDSVFENEGIEEYPVYVMIDGEGQNNDGMKETIASFPTAGYLIRDTQLANPMHLMRSIKSLIDFGYEYVLFVEEDVIIRADVIKQLENEDIEGYLEDYLMYAFPFGGGVSNHFRGFLTLFQKNGFEEMFNFVVDKEYVGMPRVTKDGIIQNGVGYQPALGAYMQSHDLLNKNAKVHSCAHIGISGSNTSFGNLSDEGKNLESWLFEGSRERWLEKAESMLSMEFDDDILYRRIKPKKFVRGKVHE